MKSVSSLSILFLVLCCGAFLSAAAHAPSTKAATKKNAYATMLYMGTPRDYEFYVAARVMLQTLARFKVDADLVVLASDTVPEKWQRTLYGVYSSLSIS